MINIVNPTLAFTPSTPTNACVGVPYDQNFQVNAALETASFNGDANGLTVAIVNDGATIKVSGTPTSSGSVSVVVKSTGGAYGVL